MPSVLAASHATTLSPSPLLPRSEVCSRRAQLFADREGCAGERIIRSGGRPENPFEEARKRIATLGADRGDFDQQIVGLAVAVRVRGWGEVSRVAVGAGG